MRKLTVFEAVWLPTLLTLGALGCVVLSIRAELHDQAKWPFLIPAMGFCVAFFVCKGRYEKDQ